MVIWELHIAVCVQLDCEDDALARQPGTLPGVRATATNMCYIIFTSGSTGRPKGTVLQHNSVINYLLGMVKCESILQDG